MPTLADTQRALRDALVIGDVEAALPMLIGADPRRRLAIHQRHYRASLVTGLLARFPATGWLVGSAPLIDAAIAFVQSHPPAAPCMAEYGADFPCALSASPIAATVPYVVPFAHFDWRLGRAAVQVPRPAVNLEVVGEALDAAGDAQLDVQPGIAYVEARWPIDILMKILLSGEEPARLSLEPEAVWLEIRGARGELRFQRLTEPDYRFRSAMARGASVLTAADLAAAGDPAFDADAALAVFVASEAIAGCRCAPIG